MCVCEREVTSRSNEKETRKNREKKQKSVCEINRQIEK